MVAVRCEWCEFLSTVADLVGLVGAIFLAYPFLRSQRLRDDFSAIDLDRVPDPKDTKLFEKAKVDIYRQVLNRMPSEYRAGWIGATLIASAFVFKFIAALPNIYYKLIAALPNIF